MRLIDTDSLKFPNIAIFNMKLHGATVPMVRLLDLKELVPSVPAVPLEPLCKLLAEMYHCPGSGWPANNRVCHPSCPDEAFENLCGTDSDNHSDEERWKAFLLKWMERLNDMDCWR